MGTCAARQAIEYRNPGAEDSGAATVSAHAAAILIVDDNPADRRLLLETLADVPMKFAAQELTTGDAAVRLAVDLGVNPGLRVPDLLIVDLHLPCVSGIDVLRAFRANPVSARVPALVLTGSASAADRATIAEIPGVQFLEKPEDMESMALVGRTIEGMVAGADRPSAIS